MDILTPFDSSAFRATLGTVVAVCSFLALSANLCFASHAHDGAASSANESAARIETDGADWSAYGGTASEDHFSSLGQINDRNIRQLGLQWWIDLPTSVGSVSAPLAIGGTLYFAVGLSVVSAVDAVSGRELWKFDPDVAAVAGERLRPAWGIRGIAYWNRRIFVGTQDGRLIALDARSGQPVWVAQTIEPGNRLYITGAPRVFNGNVIIGNGGADFGPVRGYVTAYDARDGKQVWRFYTVPGDPAKGFENKAMQMAAQTWRGEQWKQGGGGTVWNAITYDSELNRIYIGTGNGAPWNRKIRSPGGGDNLFLCSIVALNADTGEYVWHYQTTPGESWDYNSAMDIELATLPIGGKDRRVILHAPKNGFFYVIDRDSGQLISAAPFAKVTWAKGIDPGTGRPVVDPAADYPDGEALIWPGGLGAHNWQAMSYSPKARLVYIPTIHLPGYYNDKGIEPKNWRPTPGMVINTGLNYTLDELPPLDGAQMGELQAWDPIRQRRVWSVPQLGAINGGIASTAGNLVLQGQADGKFLARAADTGRELWSFDAHTGIVAQPITYLAAGRQYVTVITGFSGSASILGPLSSQFGWTYRGQSRRVLTFALGGKARLPSATTARVERPVDVSAFVVDAARAKSGNALFGFRCALCHGATAVAGGAAPDLRASRIPLSSEAFRQVVRDGALEARGMPRFGELSEEDLECLRHYIRNRARVALARAANSAGSVGPEEDAATRGRARTSSPVR